MSEFDPKQNEADRLAPAEVTPGATGIFGTLAPAGAGTPRPEPAATPVLSSSTQSQSQVVLPPAPPLRSTAPVVVHEVKFETDDQAGAEPDSSLHRLMQSLAPAAPVNASSPASQPSAPASSAPAPSPAKPSVGEFTQLLSTLSIPEPARSASTSKPVEGAPAQEAAPFGKTPVPATASAVGVQVPEASSFTQLFEALASPGPVAPVRTQMAAPEAAAGTMPPGEPAVRNFAAPELQNQEPRAQVPGSPAGERSLSSQYEEPRAQPGAAESTSFTQLFAALESPRMSATQATDYPPIRPETPAGFAPSAIPRVERRAEVFPAAPPVEATVPPAGGDLNSLTQLLRALEEFPAPQSTMAPPMPVSPPAGARNHSGATVAFTPPESVQRLASQTPAAPSGPGDFTRVLQASALRESGLGSQAAAAQHVPQPLPASTAPVVAAPSPMPPWAAPPVPHLPHLPQLGHMNSHAPGPLPLPGLHGGSSAFLPGSGPPFHAPAPAEVAAQPARMPWLPLILIGIIVVLVIVLIAVLLRK